MKPPRKPARKKPADRAAPRPAAIQPHGLLLALDPSSLKVKAASANAADFLGRPPAKVLGTAIADHVDADYAAALAAFAAGSRRGEGPSGPVALRGATDYAAGWRATSHRGADGIIVEIARAPADSPVLDRFLSDATAAMRAAGDNAGVVATATLIARRLREMSGYDRVLVLRFDPQGQGQMIAESKVPSAGASLLGLRWRADEMSASAHRNALRNPVRMMYDIQEPPVPITEADAAGRELDISDAILRAAPPARAQFLSRLGARAALMISLARNKRLWGLVILLHRTPRRLTLPYRSTLQLMADAIAVRFAVAEDQERERELARRRRALSTFERALERETGESVVAILRRHGKSLLRAAGASGAWCHLPEGDFGIGRVPGPEIARRIAAVCRVRSAGRLFATDHVGGLDPVLGAADEAAGALYVALPRSRGGLLLLREVAGPDPAPAAEGNEFLAERAAAWREARLRHGAPWSEVDLAIVPEAARAVDDVAPRLAERRSLRRALENEAKLRAILDATQDGLIAVDHAGTVLDFSSGAERLFGWSAAEIVGKPSQRLVPEEFRERHSQGLARATHDLRPRVMGGDGKLHALRKDGSTFPFEMTLTSLVLGGETLFIGALRDLTERLSGELRDRFWFEHSSVGYSVSNAIGHNRLRVNPALCNILGFSEEELLSRSVLDTMHPDDIGPSAEWRQRVVAGSDEPYRRLQRFRRKDGKTIWGRVTASPIRPLGSNLVQIVSEVVEMTDLVEADVKLRTALARAEAASASKSQFLATMSHELRTPLNAIIGLSDMIAAEVMGPLGHARYAEYVRDINRAGRHLLDLVTDVLDTSRIEAGGYRLALVPINLGDVIDETHRLVAPIAAERGVRLERRVPPELSAIRGDRRALKQVMINVVSNAIKFTPERGTVTIAAESGADGVAITVADTGTGIAPEHIAHVTEPFYRASGDAYTTGAASGAGLGLAIANGLVEAHGGSLAIASQVGKGTTVTLQFPPAPAAA